MYKPGKFRNDWNAQRYFNEHKNSGKSHSWAQGSKPDISGSVPKVAFELSKKLKNNPDSGNLSVQIEDGERKFVYSAIFSGNSSIAFDYELCKVKTREGVNIFNPPNDCYKCRSGNCDIDKKLSDLAEYMKSYGNISVKSPLDGVDSVSLILAEKEYKKDSNFSQRRRMGPFGFY
ncbi:MAG: hypothetical protein WA139_04745 [Candidatus Aenigmatarchaeota archaeon]